MDTINNPGPYNAGTNAARNADLKGIDPGRKTTS